MATQQDLGHLQRSLPSGDLGNLWRRLDRSLLASITKIRSAEHLGPLDTALVTLPIKLGGLGVLSFETCAPHAFQAAAESADLVLALAISTPGVDGAKVSEGTLPSCFPKPEGRSL